MILPDYFLLIVAAIGLFVASLFDLKTREIPDIIPYTIIGVAAMTKISLGLAVAPWYFISAIFSFGLFIIVGYLLYSWNIIGGGDAKLIMAMGVVIPGLSVYEVFTNDLLFIALLFVWGAIWNAVASVRWKKTKEGRPFAPAFILALVTFAYVLVKQVSIVALIK